MLKLTSIELIRCDRSGTSDFIVQQLDTLGKLRVAQEAREKAKGQRRQGRPRQDGQGGGMIPPVPSVPPVAASSK